MKAVLLLFVIAIPPVASAQSPPQFAVPLSLSGEIATFMPIYGSHGSVGFTPSPLQTKDHKYSTLVSTINLNADRRGDEWDLTVSVTLPTEETKVLLAKRMNEAETIKVEKFADYELFPTEVSIVRIDEIAAVAPQIINRTKSLQIETKNPSVLPWPYRVTFTNTSVKTVYGIMAASVSSRAGKEEGWLNSYCGRALIEPGAKLDAAIPSVGDYQRVETDRYRPVQSTTLDVTTVVFTDGSYEGLPRYAAIMNAEAIGERKQAARTLPLIENAMKSTMSEAETIAALRESVNTLDAEVESSDAEELRSRLAGFDDKLISDSSRSIAWGRNDVKVCVKRDLVSKSVNVTLHDWLIQEADKLKHWVVLVR